MQIKLTIMIIRFRFSGKSIGNSPFAGPSQSNSNISKMKDVAWTTLSAV